MKNQQKRFDTQTLIKKSTKFGQKRRGQPQPQGSLKRLSPWKRTIGPGVNRTTGLFCLSSTSHFSSVLWTNTTRMGTNDCWSYLSSLGVHHRSWDDPLFAEGLAVCAPLTKIPCIDIDDEDFFHPSVNPIICSVGGCKKSFTTVAEHASHQRSCHQHVCSSCKHSFPTHHLLDLHLLEVHDTLFQLMAERKPMYQCLLETCPEKFQNPTARKTHCIEVHMFPPNFRFDASWRKLEKNKSKNKETLTAEESAMDCEVTLTTEGSSLETSEGVEATGIRSQNENVRKIPKVPSSLSFGIGVGRGFNRGSRGGRGHSRKGGTHWHQRKPVPYNSRTNIEEVNMNELEAALPKEPQSL